MAPKLIIFAVLIALPLGGYWLGYTQKFNSTSQIVQHSTPEPKYCESDNCWFDTAYGKSGFGSVTGYYHPYTATETRSTPAETFACNGFVVTNTDSETFKNITSQVGYYDEFKADGSMGAIALDYALTKISSQLKQNILSSTKNHQITLYIAQQSRGGHGFTGCFPSSIDIINAVYP